MNVPADDVFARLQEIVPDEREARFLLGALAVRAPEHLGYALDMLVERRARDKQPKADQEPTDRLAFLATADGARELIEAHARPGGALDAIVAHTKPGGRPVLYGFRREADGWHQLAGSWTDVEVARTDVHRALRLQVASHQDLLFLDLALGVR
ncbi:hypothetical protein ACFYY8_33810 [Streptosporangium sp. NPDC001559]|uniref:hypothetical protein n=1 Tax=Streptosporangium sp. NPDC001559 TaxID=3366187 RepID=UPI0036EA0D4A